MTQKEVFDRRMVEELGWFNLPKGGFRDLEPRLRVQVYTIPSKQYGPIIIVFDGYIPQNPRQSKPIAQIHLTPQHAIQLIALLIKAIRQTHPIRAITIQDIFRQIAQTYWKI